MKKIWEEMSSIYGGSLGRRSGRGRGWVRDGNEEIEQGHVRGCWSVWRADHGCFGVCESEKRRKRTWWGTKPIGLYILRLVLQPTIRTPFIAGRHRLKFSLPWTFILISLVLSGLAVYGGKSNKRTPTLCFPFPQLRCICMYVCIWVDAWLA